MLQVGNGDFGDNSSGSIVSDPVHTFNVSGIYSVNLTAGNSCDNYSSVVHTISVENEGLPCGIRQFQFPM